LSKENRGRDVETAMDRINGARKVTAASKMKKIAENNYEEFIDEGSQLAEKNDNEKKDHRKALLKRNQEEFFGGAL